MTNFRERHDYEDLSRQERYFAFFFKNINWSGELTCTSTKKNTNDMQLLLKLAKSKRARNTRIINGGRASIAALVHCKLDGVLFLPLSVPFRRTIQFVLRDKRYGADERDK